MDKLRRWLPILGVALLLMGAPWVTQARPQSPPAAEQTRRCPTFPGANQFVRKIDNRFHPLEPGTTFIYRETADGETERDVVTVTNKTKTILGVKTVVVRDTVTDANGDLVEDTFDWYAQDKAGNVWYFGEDTKEYKNGRVVSTEGSWQAGVKGAKPGIVMEAKPRPGDSYMQECAPGVAEDAAKVLRLGQSVTVPFGTFDDVLVTKDYNLLEKPVEHKYYAPCIGLVRAELVKGGKEEAVLVDVQEPSGKSSSACDRSSAKSPTSNVGS
jgi:hypothetical protein